MAMVDQFSKGMFLMIDGALCLVNDRKYKTQGRQGGLIILDYKNVESGNTNSKTFKAGMKLEQVVPEYREMQYMYSDGKSIFFMDVETFETEEVNDSIVGDYRPFLKEGERYVMMLHEGRVISIRTHPTVELLVTEAVDAVKGNTANNATKIVTTDTGFKVAVPLFVNKGDVIIVNTETGQYNGRK